MLYHKPIPFPTKHSLWPQLIQAVIWQYKDFDGNSILWTFYSSPLFPAIIFSHTAQDVNQYEPEKRETQIKNNLGEKEFWTGTLSWIIYSTVAVSSTMKSPPYSRYGQTATKEQKALCWQNHCIAELQPPQCPGRRVICGHGASHGNRCCSGNTEQVTSAYWNDRDTWNSNEWWKIMKLVFQTSFRGHLWNEHLQVQLLCYAKW